jgi:glutamine amidotransferase
MIAIIDYGVGNLASVANMFRKIGVKEACVTGDPDIISKASKILLPGVGAFDGGMGNLKKSGLIPLLNDKALNEKVPVLGICLGMQMLSKKSEEGKSEGLGWIDAETIKLNPAADLNLKVPHMGWDYIQVKRENPLVRKAEKNRFYFVHSYHVQCKNEEEVVATCEFGGAFTCIVNRDNIFGAQFHPEKSLRYGMKFLENFAKLWGRVRGWGWGWEVEVEGEGEGEVEGEGEGERVRLRLRLRGWEVEVERVRGWGWEVEGEVEVERVRLRLRLRGWEDEGEVERLRGWGWEVEVERLRGWEVEVERVRGWDWFNAEEMKYNDFTEMSVWKKAMEIAKDVFFISESLPRKEDYGLTSQIRQSANGISASIAEGFGRTTSKDKSKFYDYSRGSAFETKSHLQYGREIGYFKADAVETLSEKINQVVHEINKIKSSLRP